jgi:hypothetical protein
VLLLVDSLLRCSLDALDVSVSVTKANVSEVGIFIILSLRGARTNGVGVAVMSADLVALASLWETTTASFLRLYLLYDCHLSEY